MNSTEIKRIVKVLAGFEGLEVVSLPNGDLVTPIPLGGGQIHLKLLEYTEDLNLLIPIWAALDCIPVFDKMDGLFSCELQVKNSLGPKYAVANAKTMQESAALATEIAILAQDKKTL